MYPIDIRTGRQPAEFPVGDGSPGLWVWRQLGRCFWGHTGILR